MSNGKLMTRVVAPVIVVIAIVVMAGRLVMQPDAVSDESGLSLDPAAAEPASASAEPPLAAEQQDRIVLAQSDAAATSERFQLGTHYRRLSPTQPTSSSPDQIEVAEVFWYGCPHCYTFDPYLESWKQDLSANVSFVRVPAVWNPLLQLHARLYYTAEALGKTEEMHARIFREIHVNGNQLNTEGAIQDFFAEFGVSAEEFANAFNSFAVHTKLQRADELSRRYRISSVPTVIVNGKYSTDATAAGGYETLMELIDELVASERAAN